MLMRRCAVFVVLWALACSTPRREPAPAKAAPQLTTPRDVDADDEDTLPLGKLPADVTPTSYTLSLSIDPAGEGFSGDVAIHVTLDKPRDRIWLHGQGLRVKRAQVTLADGKVVMASWQQMTPDGLARVSFAEVLQPQQITLIIGYDASFNSHLDGLYKVVAEGRPYVFAQFEAISARKCFPSFDEPRFKTPFDISIIAPKNATVVSATRIADERVDGDVKRVRFNRTEKLPTYLLTFAVGELDVVDNGPIAPNSVRPTPLPLRGVAIKGRGPMMRYALDNVAPILATLESYFGTPYPFEKLDIIAVPDFAEGGMENVGAITFRDGVLLIDPANVTVKQRRVYADLMAHELAHMWFGNTVTMQWWDDTWLNEAFANWMGNRASQAFDPSLGADIERVESALQAMNIDSLVAARQIRQPIASNHDIANAFDDITYEKGMGVLSMFESYLGSEQFRAAVRAYLQKYRFANATADDFFATLAEVGGKDIIGALRSFVEQPGVPLVGVTLTCDGAKPARVTLEQKRYLPLGSSGDENRVWGIPVCARYGVGDTTHRECWLSNAAQSTVTLAHAGCPSWIMPNADAAGYYRFALSSAESAKLDKALTAKKLSRAESLAVSDALRASVAAGTTSPVDLYRAFPTMVAQRDHRLDQGVMWTLEGVHSRYIDPDLVPTLESYARELFKGRVDASAFEKRSGEDDEARLARTSLVSFLTVEARDPSLRREAAKRGRALLGALESGRPYAGIVDPELGGVAIAAAIEEGGKPLQQRVVKALAEQGDPLAREQLVGGLAGVRDKEQVRASLDAMLSPAVRVNEIWAMIRPLATRPESMAHVWAWVQENFEAFRARVPDEHQSFIVYTAIGFCSEQRATEVQAFFEPRVDRLNGGPRGLAAVREAIGLCILRDQAQHTVINDFFRERPGAPKGPRS